MFGALRALQTLVAAHPLLLLECSSLPLLVHAAVSKAYTGIGSSSGSGSGSGSSMSTKLWAAELQEGVSALLCVVRRAAQQATSPAAAAACTMWQLWEQHPPAGLATAPAGGAGAGVDGWDRMAAAAGLMGLPGPRPLPDVPAYAGYAAGGLGGEAGTAAGARRLVAELIHASGLMGE